MTIQLGLSSGSAPGLDALALAELTRSLGGDVVDLRAGRGHRWEADGIEPFVRAGLAVAFVGTGIVLGAGSPQVSIPPVAAGSPIKVFATVGCTERDELLRCQLAAIAAQQGDLRQVLVETHVGLAGVDELLVLASSYGVRICLDLLGLALLTPEPVTATARLAGVVAAVQVKGFDWLAPKSGRHLPLAALPRQALSAVLREVRAAADGQHLPVTVESRAGTLGADLALVAALTSPVPVDPLTGAACPLPERKGPHETGHSH